MPRIVLKTRKPNWSRPISRISACTNFLEAINLYDPFQNPSLRGWTTLPLALLLLPLDGEEAK